MRSGSRSRVRLSLGDGVQPSWVTRPTTDRRVYVTGNNVAKVFEVDLDRWRVVRAFDTGPGPYNASLTPDGSTLIVTYKNGGAVGFWDTDSGRERARVATTRSLPHGVVVTPDGGVRIRHPRRNRRRTRHRRGVLGCLGRASGRRRHRQAGKRDRVLESGQVNSGAPRSSSFYRQGDAVSSP